MRAVVPVDVQVQIFSIDLHVFSLCGANLVLGVQWLKSLGLLLTNYNDLTMKFICVGLVVDLKGDMVLSCGPLRHHNYDVWSVRMELVVSSIFAWYHASPLQPKPLFHPLTL